MVLSGRSKRTVSSGFMPKNPFMSQLSWDGPCSSLARPRSIFLVFTDFRIVYY